MDLNGSISRRSIFAATANKSRGSLPAISTCCLRQLMSTRQITTLRWRSLEKIAIQMMSKMQAR